MSDQANEAGPVTELLICFALVVIGFLALTNWRGYVDRFVRDIILDSDIAVWWNRAGMVFFGLVGLFGVIDACSRLLA